MLLQVSHVNYLGVVIDDKLSWEMHIKNIRNKIASGCWALFKLKSFVPVDVLKRVYFALVHQHLLYCVSCWGGAARTKLDLLNVIQKRCIRVISNAPYNSHSSPLFKSLKILKLDDIYFLQLAKIMYRINNNTWIGEYDLIKTQSVHEHQTRSSTSSNYHIPRLKSNRTKNSISSVGPRIWLKVSKELKQLNFNHFCILLKHKLLDMY